MIKLKEAAPCLGVHPRPLFIQRAKKKDVAFMYREPLETLSTRPTFAVVSNVSCMVSGEARVLRVGAFQCLWYFCVDEFVLGLVCLLSLLLQDVPIATRLTHAPELPVLLLHQVPRVVVLDDRALV